jgi:hypothetical protein
VTCRRVRANIVAVEKNEYCISWQCVCCLRYPTCNAHEPYYLWPAHSIIIQCVQLVTERGISLIKGWLAGWLADRCSLSQQLGALQTHTTDTFPFISHTKNVPLFKFRCNIKMPGSVASGAHCIFPHYFINGKVFYIKLSHIKCVFWFSVQRLFETFIVLKNDGDQKCILVVV